MIPCTSLGDCVINSLALESASYTGTPNWAKMRETVLFPLPMDPVMPIFFIVVSGKVISEKVVVN